MYKGLRAQQGDLNVNYAKERNYRKVFLISALLITLIFSSAQAITTRDLIFARSPETSQPITTAVADAMNQAPVVKGLTPDQEAPQTAGSTVVWTGDAFDSESDELLYQFWLNGPMTGNTWMPMTTWSKNNTWVWATSTADIGVNVIDMRIRDGRHEPPWGHDSHLGAEYAISENAGIAGSSKSNSKPTLVSMKSDKQSPQDKGVTVTWTAKATDRDRDTVLYRYVLKGPSTEEQWEPMTDWTTNDVWTWETSKAKAGIYMIEVWIRDGYHADTDNWDDSKRTPFVLMQKGIIK